MVDVTKTQTIRLRVAYGNIAFEVDMPVPELVPAEHINDCSIVVVGLSESTPLEGNCGWKKA